MENYLRIVERPDGFEEIKKCPLCGGIRFKVFSEATYYFNLVSPLAIVRCQHCSLLMLSPRPAALMRRVLASGQVPEALHPYGALRHYASRSQEREPFFMLRLHTIETLLGAGEVNRQLAILDLGAASNTFVALALQNGWQAYGIDYSAQGFGAMSKTGSQSHFLLASVDHLPFVSESFDCVHANHIFEHLADPVSAIQEVRRVLRSGGLFYFELPNQIDNIMFRRDILIRRRYQRKRNLSSIHHNFFFSKKTFKRLLRNAGFRKINIKHRYEYPVAGWRVPITIVTRTIGLIVYGGSIFYGHAYKGNG